MCSISWLTWRRSALIGGLLVVVVVAVTVALYNSRSDSATEYHLEPVGTTSVPAFTKPVGNDRKKVKTPSNGGRTFEGNTPGLYAGTPKQPTCDRQALINNLQADPQRAAAWSQVQGIRSADIPSYVNQLGSVILRSDTYATNYGYGGEVTSNDVVLQAGTAAFIDKRGVPVVKCGCGNPVKATAPPKGARLTFVGPQWTSFSQTTVTVVRQAPTVINQIIMVEINNDVLFERYISQVNIDMDVDVIISQDDYPSYLAMPGQQNAPNLPNPPSVTGETTAPGSGTTAPGSGTTAPGSGTTAPGSGTTAPGSGTTAPGSGTTAPGSGTTAPGSGTTAPGSGTTAPPQSCVPPPGGFETLPPECTGTLGGIPPT